MASKKRLLVVGGVAGGASCAARARRLSEDIEIIMFERGPFVSFANCGLPYHVGKVIQKEKSLFVASPRLFKKRFNIDVRTENNVRAIDRENKEIEIPVKFCFACAFNDGITFNFVINCSLS